MTFKTCFSQCVRDESGAVQVKYITTVLHLQWKATLCFILYSVIDDITYYQPNNVKYNIDCIKEVSCVHNIQNNSVNEIER